MKGAMRARTWKRHLARPDNGAAPRGRLIRHRRSPREVAEARMAAYRSAIGDPHTWSPARLAARNAWLAAALRGDPDPTPGGWESVA